MLVFLKKVMSLGTSESTGTLENTSKLHSKSLLPSRLGERHRIFEEM